MQGPSEGATMLYIRSDHSSSGLWGSFQEALGFQQPLSSREF